MRKERGFGLVIFITLMAIMAVLALAVSTFFTNQSRQMQLDIDKMKAHYLSQAGVMKVIDDWMVSGATEMTRSYAELNVTVTGNQIFKTGVQSNFAYFTFDNGENEIWFTTLASGLRRLQQWRVKNIHNTVSGSIRNVTVTGVRVFWSPPGAHTISLRTISVQKVGFSGSTQIVPIGAYASGQLIDLNDPATLAARTLAPGESWGDVETYIEWNNNAMLGLPDSTSMKVTVRWTFADDGATKEFSTHGVIYWDGDTGGGGRPAQHTFAINSTGQVNQTDAGFKVLQSVKATVSGTPKAGTMVEITDWDKPKKSIP